MSLSEADIERVVQEVLRRLAAMMPSPLAPPSASTTLSVPGRLITVANLKGRLQGIERVEIVSRAVITPAAKDYLREQGVELIKKCK